MRLRRCSWMIPDLAGSVTRLEWSALFVAWMMWPLAASAVQADLALTSGDTRRVQLIQFDRALLTVADPCQRQVVSTVPWDAVKGLVMTQAEDTACTASSPVELPSLPPVCTDGLDSFVIHTRVGTAPLFVEDGSLSSDGVLHLNVFEPWDQAHGPIAAVRAIQRTRVCRPSIVSAGPYPADFCSEPRQVAVAFNYEAPLRNRILTNGFSFHVRHVGTVPPGFNAGTFNDELRSGFQTGLSLWMIAMQDRDAMLTPAVRQFIKGRVSTSSNGYTLFTPPQVIRLRCPQAATFVVELHFGTTAAFPRFPLALARAQVEGRTIALNMSVAPCYRSEYVLGPNKQPRFELPGSCVNLIPILAHELGHAFGLDHSDVAGVASLMDSQFSREALSPTDRDTAALVAQLERSINGAAPGVFQLVESSGVRPPADWVPGQGGP